MFVGFILENESEVCLLKTVGAANGIGDERDGEGRQEDIGGEDDEVRGGGKNGRGHRGGGEHRSDRI